MGILVVLADSTQIGVHFEMNWASFWARYTQAVVTGLRPCSWASISPLTSESFFLMLPYNDVFVSSLYHETLPLKKKVDLDVIFT